MRLVKSNVNIDFMGKRKLAIGLSTLAVIVALVALGVLWDWWRSGRAFCTPIPRPYRNRDSHKAVWRQRCGEKMGDADAVLTIATE